MTFEEYAKATYGEERYKNMPFATDIKMAFFSGREAGMAEAVEIVEIRGINQDCKDMNEYMYGVALTHNIAHAINKKASER